MYIDREEFLEKSEFITKSALKDKGWTEKLITIFLPEPDKTAPNPMYKKSSPMKLYLKSRIKIIEESEEFKNLLKLSEKSKKSAQKAVETKIEKIRKYVSTIEVVVPVIKKKSLIYNACRSYNEFKEMICSERERDFDFEPATKNSDPLFLERIVVNYLRHNLTHYEDYLEEIFGKVGKDIGYEEIRAKIFTAISITYPWLKNECERQQNYIESPNV